MQSFDPRHRVATILFVNSSRVETVPVLEIDLGASPEGLEELVQYGVEVGQRVLLCDDNGAVYPQVPVLGQRNMVNEHVYQSRFQSLADEMLHSGASDLRLPAGDPARIDWYGEVIELFLDGTCDIRLANGTIKRVEVKQLYILRDVPEFGQDGLVTIGGGDVDMASDASWETTSSDSIVSGRIARLRDNAVLDRMVSPEVNDADQPAGSVPGWKPFG